MDEDRLNVLFAKLDNSIALVDQATTILSGATHELHDYVYASLTPAPAPAPAVLPPHSKGIDVSHYQGAIDWAKARAAGIVFAYIKSSEGAATEDSLFRQNWTNAKQAGVLRGAYHFYRFADNPIVQADFVLAQLGADRGELAIAVDVEESVSPVNLQTTVKVFCERVLEVTGQRCAIYIGNWWWTPTRIGGPQAWVKDYPLWIAFWSTGPAPTIPKDWPAWSFWQHSNSGRVAGIGTAVDLDVSA